MVRKRSRMMGHRNILLALIIIVCVVVYQIIPVNPSIVAGTAMEGSGTERSKASSDGYFSSWMKMADHQQCPPRWNGGIGSIAILHVPKTAGTLVTMGLASQMPSDTAQRWCRRGGEDVSELIYNGCSGDISEAEKLAFVANLSRVWPAQCAGFGTHYDYGLFEMLNINFKETLTITTLRHPVDRAISHYYFYLLKGKAQLIPAMTFFRPQKEKKLTDYQGLVRFASMPQYQANIHTYQLGGAMGCTPGGVHPLDISEEEVLERAKRNLSKFCQIVINEYMEESLEMLKAFTGWTQHSELFNPKADVNRNTGRPKVPETVWKRIEAVNHLDMQLYEYAVQLFKQRYAEFKQRQTPTAQ